jgi:phosphatidylglycerophosphate synthase
MTGDLLEASVLLGALVMTAALYGVRVLIAGKSRSERVTRQGSGLLVGKEMMEAGYWALRPLGSACVSLGISANAVSGTSLILGAWAGASFAQGRFGRAAIVGVLSATLDAVDGWVARTTGTASPAGEVLDSLVDRYVEFAFFAGLASYYASSRAFLLITLSALLGSFLMSYSASKAETFRIELPPASMRRAERLSCLLFGATLSPFSIAWFEAPDTARGYPMLFSLLLIATISNLSALKRFSLLRRSL